jgi:hypothetical protein
MMHFRFAPVALAALALVSFDPVPAPASPANTLIEMWSHFRFCLRSAHLDKGVDLTLRFSLKRDGSLNGKPMVSYFNMPDDTEAERRNADAVAQAIDHCLPVSISDTLGNAIAGRPMWIRFHGPRRERET